MKKIIIPILIVFFFGGAIYFLWTTTPEYSFLKIRNAIETNNLEVGMKYTDADSIFDNLWQKEIQNLNSAELEKLSALFSVPVNEESKTLVKEEVKQGIRQWFFPSLKEDEKESTTSSNILSEQNNFKVQLVRDSNTNTVYIEQPNNIKIIFSKKPGRFYWAVTEIQGFLQLISKND